MPICPLPALERLLADVLGRRRRRCSRRPPCRRDPARCRSRAARPSARPRPAPPRARPAPGARSRARRPLPAPARPAHPRAPRSRGSTSGQVRSLRTSRMPQLMSKPMPPGEITPAARVDGGHAADREAVAPVRVGHHQARPDDARQRRDVGRLHEDLLVHLADELLGGEDARRHAHALARVRRAARTRRGRRGRRFARRAHEILRFRGRCARAMLPPGARPALRPRAPRPCREAPAARPSPGDPCRPPRC